MGGRYAGFLHFGLSSVGSFIYLMGIWGYLIITAVYTYFMSCMCSEGTKTIVHNYFCFGQSVVFLYDVFDCNHAIVWSIFIFFMLNSVGMVKHG